MEKFLDNAKILFIRYDKQILIITGLFGIYFIRNMVLLILFINSNIMIIILILFSNQKGKKSLPLSSQRIQKTVWGLIVKMLEWLNLLHGTDYRGFWLFLTMTSWEKFSRQKMEAIELVQKRNDFENTKVTLFIVIDFFKFQLIFF